MNEKFLEFIKSVMKYLNINFDEEDAQTLLDFSELSGDDIEDLFKRKLIADLVIAKKLKIVDKFKFLKIFGYKR